MREIYNGPTPETETALANHVQQIAYELHKKPQYLNAILGGASADPFAKFVRLFRAVARKNPEGARGYIAHLSTILNQECPPPGEVCGIYELTQTYNNVLAVLAQRDDGHAWANEVEKAKQQHLETLARVGARARRGQEVGG